MIKKNVEIIGLIYQSPAYFNFMKSNFLDIISQNNDLKDWKIGVRIIANNPNQKIINEMLKYNTIHKYNNIDFIFDSYHDPKPNDHYLARTYRCWNYGAKSSAYDNIIFWNSDFMGSKNWLQNLLKHHNGVNIPCSRLVESNKMMSGQHAHKGEFGRHPNEITRIVRENWYNLANIISEDKIEEGGLYMPVIFETKRFIEAGMYPEGNIGINGEIAFGNKTVQSGDDWFFRKLEKEYNMKHVTVFDSVVYHVIEGEKDAGKYETL